MPEWTVQDIADKLGGVCVGSAGSVVKTVASLEDADPEALSFLANPKYLSQLSQTRAAAVIVRKDVTCEGVTLIQVDNPDLAFTRACDFLLPKAPRPAAGLDPAASVSPKATLGEDCAIGAGAVIEAGAVLGRGVTVYPLAYVGYGAVLGDAVVLYPGACVMHGCRLGDRCVLQPNAVVGGDGFGYVWDGQGHCKIPQVGIVELGHDVELGVGVAVDRARFGKTVIGDGTKLDNQVQIAHNVKLGPHCAFAAQSGVSGSTKVGAGVLMGGQAGVAGHLTIGDGARLSGRAGVLKDVPAGAHATGYPAREHEQQLDEWRHLKVLPRLRTEVKALKERIAKLEDQAEDTGR